MLTHTVLLNPRTIYTRLRIKHELHQLTLILLFYYEKEKKESAKSASKIKQSPTADFGFTFIFKGKDNSQKKVKFFPVKRLSNWMVSLFLGLFLSLMEIGEYQFALKNHKKRPPQLTVFPSVVTTLETS